MILGRVEEEKLLKRKNIMGYSTFLKKLLYLCFVDVKICVHAFQLNLKGENQFLKFY
jgi:hypothetical protein